MFKMPMNLQLFAEGGEGGNGDQNTGNQQNQQQAGQQQNQTAGIDYDKIQAMLDTATAKKENAVLKSYFQQQGMTEEEARQAIEAYKVNKQSQQPDVSKIQAQLQQAQALASQAEIEKLATIEAIGLGIDVKTVPYVLKMADLSTVKGDDGKVNQETLKNALNKVLEDVPALKPTNQGNVGFQIGGNGQQDQQSNNNDNIRKMFGLKPKQ
ncbi:hypothetical protein SAMN02746066_04083 [Anaerosporobacter mobilis DSM 15930]|jgi:hypothetical protein|uniref:Phage minor structural protein GP20 n=1 Tax=Anaerosporobacter mobilis DSM 15930 TaxID=1120996 RepID=A0A1M7MWR1_9FIRM|nr:hypothetical protein [Anaerosporobacter mobilis]SHM95624.1 hypothetical protein SAMN02746066_04083 [Anaerosporobacter mobilis DSM 15930]